MVCDSPDAGVGIGTDDDTPKRIFDLFTSSKGKKGTNFSPGPRLSLFALTPIQSALHFAYQDSLQRAILPPFLPPVLTPPGVSFFRIRVEHSPQPVSGGNITSLRRVNGAMREKMRSRLRSSFARFFFSLRQTVRFLFFPGHSTGAPLFRQSNRRPLPHAGSSRVRRLGVGRSPPG